MRENQIGGRNWKFAGNPAQSYKDQSWQTWPLIVGKNLLSYKMNVPKLFKQNLISTLKQNLLNALQPIQTYKKKFEFLPLLVKIIKVKAGSKMGIFSRQSTGVYNTMSQSKKHVFGVNERFIHKEFVIECFGKNIWTILEERSQNKNQN